jgi:hypothetical protein
LFGRGERRRERSRGRRRIGFGGWGRKGGNEKGKESLKGKEVGVVRVGEVTKIVERRDFIGEANHTQR